MIYHAEGICYEQGKLVPAGNRDTAPLRRRTITARILAAHEKNAPQPEPDPPAENKAKVMSPGDSSAGICHLTMDGLLSQDITYVNIIQTARASGMERFPLPYALTNCHNSLCAVGGTINEDDHLFGLTAAKKYGGDYVPANMAVIHQYAREMMAGCGRMIMGSDSHTRYGALGTMGIGEGGPELVKQLLSLTYDIPRPQVVLVYVTGRLRHGVGPHDVALLLCRELFGTVKNMVLEFCGPGIAGLSMDERMGIDVMTTETSCLSSVWETDEKVQAWLALHGRLEAYRELRPLNGAYYDHYVELDLSAVEPMIALPFHPSNALPIRQLKQDPHRYLDPIGLSSKIVDGKILTDQAEIAGCAGGLLENIAEASAVLSGRGVGNGAFSLNIYPASVPVELALSKAGIAASLLEEGAVIKPCFCGPCFGAGDVPANGGFSIRHTTRNFPSREGAKPGEGQKAYVALMDARSIAATASCHGELTGADELDYSFTAPEETFDKTIYEKRCFFGWREGPKPEQALVCGPNIKDWPSIPALKDDLLVELAAVIRDEVTTTDELIPSGETSSFRSNPIRLAQFALSRREPQYVPRTKAIREKKPEDFGFSSEKTSFGSAIYCLRPGDGSAREQAASCQRVLGGAANLCREYATKRYRSNVINWGMIPFTVESFPYETGTLLYVPGIRKAVLSGDDVITAQVVLPDGRRKSLELTFGPLTREERQILAAGCLMNWYREGRKS